ncbi:hypothetical protein [Cupriavidus laharis]|nr:hypothetical protein [Cupriavidus laharis]
MYCLAKSDLAIVLLRSREVYEIKSRPGYGELSNPIGSELRDEVLTAKKG